jgi:hypothetical protein
LFEFTLYINLIGVNDSIDLILRSYNPR